MSRLLLFISLLGLACFICWALTDIGNTAEREAAQRHGQSGAIGGGWGNAGRD